MTRFILTLSDQQLATGLAVLIAAMENQCTLTEYDFEMAFSLAWFSATTHLATLDYLSEYFRKHPTVWTWRVLGMVGIASLLIYGMAHNFKAWDRDPSLTVNCPDTLDVADGNDTSDLIGGLRKTASVLVSVFLVWNYCKRIMWTYRSVPGSSGKNYRFRRILFYLRTRAFQQQHQVTVDELNTLFEVVIADNSAVQLRRGLQGMQIRRGGETSIWSFPAFESAVHIYRNHYLRAINLYMESFISRSPPVTFMISFGLSQITKSRWLVDGQIMVDPAMGFGQITPLFLLVLPLFAGAEIYYGQLLCST